MLVTVSLSALAEPTSNTTPASAVTIGVHCCQAGHQQVTELRLVLVPFHQTVAPRTLSYFPVGCQKPRAWPRLRETSSSRIIED